MLLPTQISIPTVVRAKDGALDRLGIYLGRAGHTQPAVLISKGLKSSIAERARQSLQQEGCSTLQWLEVDDNRFEAATDLFAALPSGVSAIVGLGGGKALDVAKYVGSLAHLPYYAVPTSLSNDGFCSPQSSLTIRGGRRSLAASMPFAVIIDTAVCSEAPRVLLHSGVGDLVAKFTAVYDWKLAFHAVHEPVNDLAALLSDGSVRAFLQHPRFDAEGIRLLATGLLLNGVAMEISGSSRPASGSEHLISHALDAISSRPRLHGLQVGVATYLVSRLQGMNSERIAAVFDATNFWDAVYSDPFSRDEWLAAVRMAPSVKPGFYTILSSRDVLPEVKDLLDSDQRLAQCFAAPS